MYNTGIFDDFIGDLHGGELTILAVILLSGLVAALVLLYFVSLREK